MEPLMDPRKDANCFFRPPFPPSMQYAVVLACDTGGIMKRCGAMEDLNKGLERFGRILQNDAYAANMIDVKVFSYDAQIRQETPFRSAAQYTAPILSAGSMSAQNEAILTALRNLQVWRECYRKLGVCFQQMFLFFIVNAMETDRELEAEAKRMLQERYARDCTTVFILAVGDNVNIDHLRSYLPNRLGGILQCDELHLTEALEWFAKSLMNMTHKALDGTECEHVSTLPLPYCIRRV